MHACISLPQRKPVTKFKPRTPYERDVKFWYCNMVAVAQRVRQMALDAGHFLCAAYTGRGQPRKPGKVKLGVLWRHGVHRNYQFINLGDTYLFPTPLLTTCPTVCVVGANYPEFRITTPTTNYHVLEVNRRTACGHRCVPSMAVQCTPDEAMAAAEHLFDWMNEHQYGVRVATPLQLPTPGTLDAEGRVPLFTTARAAHAVTRWRRQAATIDLKAALSRTL